jgi:hypothetical protein
MKNKVFKYVGFGFIALIGIILTFSSCKKYLAPDALSSFTPAVVFSNIPNAKAALMGAYLSMSGDYGYGIRASYYYPYDTDDLMGGGAGLDQSRHQVAHYTLQAGNADIGNTYNQFYGGIERANNCIYFIPKMSQYSGGTAIEQGQLRRMLGEALVLRAQFYYELVRNWGDLPAQWLPATLSDSIYRGRTDRDTIYQHLLDDLAVASTLIPWRTNLGTVGDTWDQRFTKGAAKALRAKIALAKGGYSLRQNGQILRPSNYLDYYKIAFAECDTLLQHREQHTLESTCKYVWKDVIGAHKATDPTGEIIMRVAMTAGTNSDSKLGCQNGTKINGVGGSLGMVLPTYFYSFDSTDVRRDISCYPYEIWFDIYAKGHAINSIYDGKFRKDWVTNPTYYISGGLAATSSTAASNSSIQNMELDWPLIRFSDVLLMYAETSNEINGAPNAAAISAWNEVSLRAHSGIAAQVPVAPTDHDGFFKLLVRERFLEFGGEGIRKYDLLRWNLLGTALSQTLSNLRLMAAGTAMVAPTYMAPPPAYTLTNTLPRYMYIYNRVNIFGDNYTNTRAIWANSSYYKTAPDSASIKPDVTIIPNIADVTKGTTYRVAWGGPNTAITTTFVNYLAYGFITGHSELFPIPQASIDANPNLRPQNPGY